MNRRTVADVPGQILCICDHFLVAGENVRYDKPVARTRRVAPVVEPHVAEVSIDCGVVDVEPLTSLREAVIVAVEDPGDRNGGWSGILDEGDFTGLHLSRHECARPVHDDTVCAIGKSAITGIIQCDRTIDSTAGQIT
ncbi:hypothetical protein DSECCO2_575000 [anaerobic digester metagenome]